MEVPGRFLPGKKNLITDVQGVTVGHCTLESGTRIHTGVTVISPHPGDPYRLPCPAAVFTGNGYGKLAGSIQVNELGELESLIGLTNTLSVPAVLQGIVEHHVKNSAPVRSINPLVGETNDGGLNDIASLYVTPAHAHEAIETLSADFLEGAVGAGTGTRCFSYKGGIGSASRTIPGSVIGEPRGYTVGALVQSNFSGNLNIYGRQLPYRPLPDKTQKGSCMVLLATDAPMLHRQLMRLAKRGILGLAYTGSYLANGSGDFCIAFSNYPGNIYPRDTVSARALTALSDEQLDPFFESAADAVREAVYNSLLMAVDVEGFTASASAFDIREIL